MGLSEYDQEILNEVERRPFWNPLDGLFPRQLDVINDPARRKCLCTSRRAGKTYLDLRYLIHISKKYPNSVNGYLTKTRLWAKDLMWLELHKLNQEHELGIQFNNAELQAVFPNGSVIKLAGANDIQEADKLRGFAYHLLILDEIQSVQDRVMSYIVTDILPAALGDYSGTLMLSGTPPESCAGYFADAATDPRKGFSRHSWTVADNPEFPQWAGKENWQDLVHPWLAQERIDHNLRETDAAYRREYLGEFVREASKFIYELGELNKLDAKDIPEDLILVLGIDSGWHDETAFIVVGYEPYEQRVYHVESYSESKMTYYQIEAKAAEITEKYASRGGIETAVYDPAGEGKTIGESLTAELGQRFDLTVEFAEKQKKRNFMLLCKSDMKVGRVKIQYPSKLWDQLSSLQWNDARTREREGQPCDEADGWLYGWRHCFQWIKETRPEIKPPEMKDKDWAMELERREYFEELRVRKEELEMNEEDYDTWDD